MDRRCCSATSPRSSTGWKTTRSAAGINGSPAVIIDIQRQPGANVIETVDRILAELPRLKRAMPAGVELTVVSDRTDTIRASVHDVQFTLMLTVVLVVLVVLLFLRTSEGDYHRRCRLPLSLIATFGVM